MKKPVQRKPPMDAVLTVRVDKTTADALKAARINLSATVREYLCRVAKSLPGPDTVEIGGK